MTGYKMGQDSTNVISVIIPVYNVENYIDECMQSIFNQSYKNLEIILVDDGSTDRSGLICDQYAQQDSRVVVVHQKNRGVSHARNQGLRQATGNYIAFMDGDDIVVHTYFEVLKTCIDATEADIAKCDAGRFTSNQKVPYISLQPNVLDSKVKQSKQDLLSILYCKGAGAWSGIGSKLYKTSVLNGIRFDTSIAYDEDFDFLCRAVKKAQRISATKFVGYLYRVRPGSAMQSGFQPRMLESLERRLKEIDNDVDVARAQRVNIILNAMYRVALIPNRTKRFKREQTRLWQIILELRSDVVFDWSQRIDHKMSTVASYLGRRSLNYIVRTVKKIKLESEM